jgi:transposase InsO family protein
MERERKARSAHVIITAPGIVRGFDAMHVTCVDGLRYWLIAGDGAVPYRTSIATVPAYDSEHVVAALIADFEHAGPPLVIRLDRIACQRTHEVADLLARYGVLVLHGPPRYPRYYGQLERQNRDHRAWLNGLDAPLTAQLPAAADAMRTALNRLWARPTLDWCTAEQAWQQRPTVNVDRLELRRDVDARAASLVSNGVELLRARRFAIESALEEHGLLTINPGGSC